ncbi:NAD-dependent protein deacetylase [Gammaproteobacteria bacterium LSUCC0112]|nr:NAD-dependent protein deacetylase [Gammaproteobacteria bacterium LSUCC0112]
MTSTSQLAAHNALQNSSYHQLLHFLTQYPDALALTGAGISTGSGIPDYRDQNGNWKRKQPVQHQDFMRSHPTRQRYWARSLVGWPIMQTAQPNAAHFTLSALEQRGYIKQLVTQNVDRLHQKAGSHSAIDLHGRADEVICMQCDFREPRAITHKRCADANPAFANLTANAAPDGDADLDVNVDNFKVPGCPDCGGILKPDVVFFGDNVPRERVNAVFDTLNNSSALIVIGSSLMVFSGFRFAREARLQNKPLLILTQGKTRADDIATLKIDAEIVQTLTSATDALISVNP